MLCTIYKRYANYRVCYRAGVATLKLAVRARRRIFHWSANQYDSSLFRENPEKHIVLINCSHIRVA